MTGSIEPLAAAIASGVFAVFVWALRGHFVSASVPAGMWLVSAVSACAFVIFLAGLATTTLSLPQLAAGAAAHLSALVLFMAAVRSTRQRRVTLAFDRDPPAFLIRDGVYRRLRHPFYASYILFWTGCCVQVLTPAMLTGTAALGALYLCAALAEERKFAASGLAEAHRQYCREAGLFWPKPLGRRSEP